MRSGVHNLEASRLAGEDLRGFRLEDVDLARADLRRADLRGLTLTGSDLREADLRMAKLNGACLRGARLDAAKLDGAEMPRVDLTGAKLVDASAVSTTMEDAILRNADLSGTRFGQASRIGANLRGADLGGAVYTERTAWPSDDDLQELVAEAHHLGSGKYLFRPTALNVPSPSVSLISRLNKLVTPTLVAEMDENDRSNLLSRLSLIELIHPRAMQSTIDKCHANGRHYGAEARDALRHRMRLTEDRKQLMRGGTHYAVARAVAEAMTLLTGQVHTPNVAPGSHMSLVTSDRRPDELDRMLDERSPQRPTGVPRQLRKRSAGLYIPSPQRVHETNAVSDSPTPAPSALARRDGESAETASRVADSTNHDDPQETAFGRARSTAESDLPRATADESVHVLSRDLNL